MTRKYAKGKFKLDCFFDHTEKMRRKMFPKTGWTKLFTAQIFIHGKPILNAIQYYGIGKSEKEARHNLIIAMIKDLKRLA